MRTFTTNINDTLALKDWILTHECERVAMEATGIYWYPIYNLLEEHVTVQVANPLFIKEIAKKREELAKSICGSLDENDVYLIRLELDAIGSVNRLIDDLKQRIS
jgi:transposase